MKQYSERIEQALQGLSGPAEPRELYEPIRYMLSLGGKRLRPVLTLLGYELFREDSEKALPAALAVEVFHNFSLVHDDIMDNAPLRRGQPTVYKKWNSNIAILSGDVMLVQAYQLLAKLDPKVLPEALQLFNHTAILVCEGQQRDMNFEQRSSVSMDEYLQMIEEKTAVLLGAALQLGAIAAEASSADAKALYDFGKNIGVAFQLQDDYLDAFGDPEKFGKQVGGDILSNKKTWLLIQALEKAKGADAQTLQVNLQHTNPDSHKVLWVVDLYRRLGIVEEIQEAIQHYSHKAISQLEKVQAAPAAKAMLVQLAEGLLVRQQ